MNTEALLRPGAAQWEAYPCPGRLSENGTPVDSKHILTIARIIIEEGQERRVPMWFVQNTPREMELLGKYGVATSGGSDWYCPNCTSRIVPVEPPLRDAEGFLRWAKKHGQKQMAESTELFLQFIKLEAGDRLTILESILKREN